QQGDRKIRYSYDSAGNRVRIHYPGGREVLKEYDALRRVTAVRDGAKSLTARYAYRCNGQLRSQKIANLLEADFAYDARRGLLKEIVYRSIANERFSEGSRYQFDVVGNRIQEAQLHRGEKFGEQYLCDSASRLVQVRYGMKDLDDPKSEFAEEVEYDL